MCNDKTHITRDSRESRKEQRDSIIKSMYRQKPCNQQSRISYAIVFDSFCSIQMFEENGGFCHLFSEKDKERLVVVTGGRPCPRLLFCDDSSVSY